MEWILFFFFMSSFPFLTIRAKDHFDLGFQIGKQLQDPMRHRLKTSKIFYTKFGLKPFDELRIISQKFLPAIKASFPLLISEMDGMSLGSGIQKENLLVTMCEEELLDLHSAKIPKCTNVAMKTPNGMLLGHNEDWLVSYRRNGLYVLNTVIGKQHSLSVNYMCSLPGSSCGMNTWGVSFAANSLTPNRTRFGIPVSFQLRAILGAKTMQEAITFDRTNSSICSNTTYVWKDQRMLDEEDFLEHEERFEGQRFMIHTNHPIKFSDRNKNNTDKESIDRLKRAEKILGASSSFNLLLLKKILKDHETGICGHPKRKDLWGATLASVIMNPKEQWMEVSEGNPCVHAYKRYHLT